MERGVSTVTTLEQRIERQGYALGFDRVGFVRLDRAETAAHYDEWLARGYEGEMRYMARDPELRRDPRLPHPGASSAIVVAMDYGGGEPTGPVARYARGADYHTLMWSRLDALRDWLVAEAGGDIGARGYVDTAPVLERDLARRAGFGWFGKNTTLIDPQRGSYFFIGSLFTSLALAPSAPFEADRCGTCTRCLDACPTQAFAAPRVLDATRCISYLTIELRSAIPEALRATVGEWIYGCDVCQEVCPWNVRFARRLPDESPFAPREALGGKDARTLARELLAMTQEEFARAFKDSPMKRAKLRGLKRNAAVVLGNVGTAEDEDVLTQALDDEEPLVRAHAVWALDAIWSRRAR